MIRPVVLRWVPVAVYMAGIFVLSSVPHPAELPSGVSDKTGHLVLYAGLAAVVVRAVAGGWRERVTWSMAWTTMAICTAYAVTDEVHQHFVPPRQADVLDVAADAAGAALVAGAFVVASRSRPPRAVGL